VKMRESMLETDSELWIRTDELCCVSENISGDVSGVVVIPEQCADDNQENEFHVKREKFGGRS
jgi:hypothetical protein